MSYAMRDRGVRQEMIREAWGRGRVWQDMRGQGGGGGGCVARYERPGGGGYGSVARYERGLS